MKWLIAGTMALVVLCNIIVLMRLTTIESKIDAEANNNLIRDANETNRRKIEEMRRVGAP